jgi:hypothetical protein
MKNNTFLDLIMKSILNTRYNSISVNISIFMFTIFDLKSNYDIFPRSLGRHREESLSSLKPFFLLCNEKAVVFEIMNIYTLFHSKNNDNFRMEIA